MRRSLGIGLALIILGFMGVYLLSQHAPPAPIPAPPTVQPPPTPPPPGASPSYATLYVGDGYQEELAGTLPVALNSSALLAEGTVAPKLFEAGGTTADTPLRDAILEVFQLNASQVTPWAWYAAADLAGYAYPTPTPRNSTSYILEPVPLSGVNNASAPPSQIQPDLEGVRLIAEYPPTANPPADLWYPPSAHIKWPSTPTTSILSQTEVKSGSYVYVYYTVLVSVEIPFTVYNGNQACMYASGDAYVENPCSPPGAAENTGTIVMNFTESTEYGGMEETATFNVRDSIQWDGAALEREWYAGQATLALSVYTVEETVGNTTYIYYEPQAAFMGSGPVNPEWAPQAPAVKSEVYAYNMPTAYYYGENLWRSVYQALWALISANTTTQYWRYRAFELDALTGMIGGEINTTPTGVGSIAGGGTGMDVEGNPYAEAFLTGNGTQAEAATIPLLVDLYTQPVKVVGGGEYFNGSTYVPHVFGLTANISMPPGYLNSSLPYFNTTVESYPGPGAEVGYLADPTTSPESNGLGDYWWYNSTTQLYTPMPTQGSTSTFYEYYYPGYSSGSQPQPITAAPLEVAITEYNPGVYGYISSQPPS
jgi:hypothetical protein